MSERERFEEAYDSGKIYSTAHESEVQFQDYTKQMAWAAWQAACPAVYQCVPKEPTEEMTDSVMWATHDNTARCIWVDMLASAPSPGDT